MDRPICGHLDCGVCAPRVRRFLRVPRARRVDLPGACPPTAAALERHARKFGPAGVAEVAAEFGLTVDLGNARRIERRPTRRRSTGQRDRIADLVARGASVESIAEVEDLSPSRARRLIEDLKGAK